MLNVIEFQVRVTYVKVTAVDRYYLNIIINKCVLSIIYFSLSLNFIFIDIKGWEFVDKGFGKKD